jgi:hypothetical protein
LRRPPWITQAKAWITRRLDRHLRASSYIRVCNPFWRCCRVS